MRELKYKFWDREEKHMIGPNLDSERYYIGSYNGLALFDTEREDEDGYTYQMDVEFLQYTGIKDCNGTEIYAGYVIQMDCGCDSEYGCSHGPWQGYVEWDPETASYELRDMDGKWSGEAFEDSMTDEYLVVGNIYETPLEDTP